MDQKEGVRIKNSYLAMIYLSSYLTNYPVGFVLASYNTAGVVIESMESWPHTYTVLITAAGILGLMLGCLLCDFFMPFGRIKTIYLANILLIVSVLP